MNSMDVKTKVAREDELKSECEPNVRECRALKEALFVANSRIAELERDLAQSREEIRECRALKEALFVANSRIAELERDLAQSREETKKIETERDDLRITLEKLQSRVEGAFIDTSSPPLDGNTSVVSSSSSNHVINETATDSKSCQFLSIDDLLALPENADLLAQLQASQLMSTMPDVGKSYVFFTVVSHLITRGTPSLPKSNPVDGADGDAVDKIHLVTRASPPLHKTNPTDGADSDAIDEVSEFVETRSIQTQNEEKKVAVKRRGAPRGPRKKQTPAKKRKLSATSVSEEETDIDYVLNVLSSTESEDIKSDIERKQSGTNKKHAKKKCKVCAIEDRKITLFNSQQALNCHLVGAHPLNTHPHYFRCPYGDNENECIRHYVTKLTLRKHIEACHPDANKSILLNDSPKPRSWQCAYCGCTFASNRIYQKHMIETHPYFAKTVKITKTPQSRDELKSKDEPANKQTPTNPKLLIKRKQGKFTVSRKSSLSSVDEDYVPESASPPSRRRKLLFESEPGNHVKVVTSAEVHEPSKIAVSSTPTDKNKASADVGNINNQSSTASDPADLNEFVLNSVYEISSMIEKQNGSSNRHPATNWEVPSLEPSHKIPQFSVPPSLPCLSDDCSGCEFHPKTTFTLDDEFVLSCREEILADLYSIPDNPPMVPGSFTDTLSSQSEFDFAQTDASDGEAKHAGSSINTNHSIPVNDFDIANVIISDDHNDQETRNSIGDVSIENIENVVCVENTVRATGDDTQKQPILNGEEKQTNVEKTVCTENTSHAIQDENQKEALPNGEENCTNIEQTVCTENPSSATEDNNREELVLNEKQSISKGDRISNDALQATSTVDEIITVNEKPVLDNDETILAESAPQVCEDVSLNRNVAPNAGENGTETSSSAPVESWPPADSVLPPSQENISASVDLVLRSTDDTVQKNTNASEAMTSSDTEKRNSVQISPENETSLQIPESPQPACIDEMPKLCLSSESLLSLDPDDSPADKTTDAVSINTSASNMNSTFYDEFGLSNVCEIETVNEKEYSRESTPPSVSTQIDFSTQKSNHITANYLILKTGSTNRCTNQIIDGVGIEVEIGPHSSSPSSSHSSDIVNAHSPHRLSKERPPNDHPSDNTKEKQKEVETDVDAVNKLTLSNSSSYPVLSHNSDFASMLKRMLTDQSLGKLSKVIVQTTPMEIDASPSSSSTSEFSKSSENSEQAREKDDLETNAVPAVASLPTSSPLPPPSVLMSPNSTTENQITENQCTSADTALTASSSPSQAESHHAVESNSENPENATENSPLITSSSQDLVPDSSSSSNGLDNEKDPDAKYYKALTSKDKLIKITISLPRLRIDNRKPISSRYHLRRQKSASYSISNLISSARKKGTKLKRAFSCKTCSQIYFNTLALSQHINKSHKGAEGTITCSLCGFVSQNKTSLANHRAGRHKDFTPWQCVICGEVYSCHAHLSRHLRREHCDS